MKGISDEPLQLVDEKPSRYFIDFSELKPEIWEAMSEQNLSSGKMFTGGGAEYVKQEIVGPYFMFRYECKKRGVEPPKLSDVLDTLIHQMNLI